MSRNPWEASSECLILGSPSFLEPHITFRSINFPELCVRLCNSEFCVVTLAQVCKMLGQRNDCRICWLMGTFVGVFPTNRPHLLPFSWLHLHLLSWKKKTRQFIGLMPSSSVTRLSWAWILCPVYIFPQAGRGLAAILFSTEIIVHALGLTSS